MQRLRLGGRYRLNNRRGRGRGTAFQPGEQGEGVESNSYFVRILRQAHAVAIGPASITPYKYMKFRPRGGAAAPAAPGGCALPASLLRRCRAAC
jgi:hypothetical protein